MTIFLNPPPVCDIVSSAKAHLISTEAQKGHATYKLDILYVAFFISIFFILHFIISDSGYLAFYQAFYFVVGLKNLSRTFTCIFPQKNVFRLTCKSYVECPFWASVGYVL